MVEKNYPTHQLEEFLNKYSNAANILIENHFNEVFANTSNSKKSMLPEPEAPSILCSMINKFYPNEFPSRGIFDILLKNENILKKICSLCLDIKLDSINYYLHEHFLKNNNNNFPKQIISLVANQFQVCKNYSNNLSYSSKIHVALKAIEILKSFYLCDFFLEFESSFIQ